MTSQELKELPSVTKLMQLADDYVASTHAINHYAYPERELLKQAIEVVVHKRIEAQVEAEVLKDKLARIGVETRRKYNSVLQEAFYVIDAWERECEHEDYWRDREVIMTKIKELLGQT